MMVLEPGKKVFIRGITNYYTGLVHSVDDRFVYLMEAAWIPLTGRFSDALQNGEFEEVEPYPDGIVAVQLNVINDVSIWGHALPREQK